MICAIALVLAIDVSGSVSQDNFFLQRDATARALVNPAILRTIEPERPIALSVVTWGDAPHLSVDWGLVASPEDMEAFADRVRRMSRSGTGATNMSRALSFAVRHLDSVPCEPERRVIDVSGDGRASDEDPVDIRDSAERDGIQINGLPIVTDEPEVADYYRRRVVTSDGFVVESNDWEGYYRAVRRKLILEIAGVLE